MHQTQNLKTLRTLFCLTAMCISLGLFTAAPAYGQTPAKSTTPVITAVPTGNAKMDELKARLATKVAELRTTVKRAMYGTVKSVSVTSATVETKTKDIKIELTDDVGVTQVINGKRTELTLDDIAAKDKITVFGTYDESLDLLKAQYIFIEDATTILRLSGIIINTDEKEFTVTVKTPEGRDVLVDFEKTTKTSAWTKEAGIAKSGFSKLIVGNTVHISGTEVPKTENRIRADRILDIGNITGAAIPTGVPQSVTPTAAVTPKATLKPTVKPTATPTP